MGPCKLLPPTAGIALPAAGGAPGGRWGAPPVSFGAGGGPAGRPRPPGGGPPPPPPPLRSLGVGRVGRENSRLGLVPVLRGRPGIGGSALPLLLPDALDS